MFKKMKNKLQGFVKEGPGKFISPEKEQHKTIAKSRNNKIR
jgi:hypothetical protein